MNDTRIGRRGFLGALAATGGALMSGAAQAGPAANSMLPGP
ncbi:MAG: twin-arginine translocation signal domain-containing protein, partial [Rhizomicrobium sp.]